MYKCYSDVFGNMPCDNGCICDKCLYMDVEIIKNDDVYFDEWDDEFIDDINALNDILNIK